MSIAVESGAPPDPGGGSRRERIEQAMSRLDSVQRVLRSYGTLVVLSVVACLVLQAFAVASHSVGMSATPAVPMYCVSVAFAFVVTGVVALFRWEAMRREGMVIYEEVSDEVEWQHRSLKKPVAREDDEIHAASQLNAGTAGRERPSIDIRIGLRRFLNSASLPFGSVAHPGGYYVAVYLLLFFANLALVIWFGKQIGEPERPAWFI